MAFYKAVTVYKTKDGKIFESEEKAKDHIEDKFAMFIAAKCEDLKKQGRFTQNDIYTFVAHLVPDMSAVQAFKEWFNYFDGFME